MRSGVIHHPGSVKEALALLAAEPEARPIAGGASLVAMVNAGLVNVSALVSLKKVCDGSITVLSDGSLRIGAMTRHWQSAESAILTGTRNCLREAAQAIGNMPVRNMGTMGGSISLADPGADYPSALVALGATVEVAGQDGFRHVPAAEFFVDWYTTAVNPGELVTAISLPAGHEGIGSYRKLARVAGDFAIISVTICVSKAGAASVAIGGAGPRPVFDPELNAILSAKLACDSDVEDVGRRLAALSDPVDDVRASADYRRTVIPRLLLQSVRDLRTRMERADG